MMSPKTSADSATTTRVDGRTLRYAGRRKDLLDKATEYVLEVGIRDLALRPMAEALGISHASLLRHFKSKEDLVLTVLENIRQRVATQLDAAVSAATTGSVAEVVRTAWQALSDPRERGQFLLLFELADVRNGTNPDIVAALIGDWVSLIGALFEAEGEDAGQAEAKATLLLAQIRGLQLDLMLTEDADRVDQALEVALVGM